MLSALQKLVGIVVNLGTWVVWAAMTFVNLLVEGVGKFIAQVVQLLPRMPNADPAPAVQWLSWFVPVGPILAGLAAFVACWVAWLGISVAARWMKAV